jgi:hypothetical protein
VQLLLQTSALHFFRVLGFVVRYRWASKENFLAASKARSEKRTIKGNRACQLKDAKGMW